MLLKTLQLKREKESGAEGVIGSYSNGYPFVSFCSTGVDPVCDPSHRFYPGQPWDRVGRNVLRDRFSGLFPSLRQTFYGNADVQHATDQREAD